MTNIFYRPLPFLSTLRSKVPKTGTIREESFAVGSFESILRNKQKILDVFLQMKGVIMVKVRKKYVFVNFAVYRLFGKKHLRIWAKNRKTFFRNHFLPLTL